jgi:hypothetical protein
MIEPIDDALAAWEQVLTELGSPGYADPREEGGVGAAAGAEGAGAVGCGVEAGRPAGVPVAAAAGVAAGLTVWEGCVFPGAGGEEGDGVARVPPRPAGPAGLVYGAGLAGCPAMAGAGSAARLTPASSGRKTVTARTAIVAQARPTVATTSFGLRPVA